MKSVSRLLGRSLRRRSSKQPRAQISKVGIEFLEPRFLLSIAIQQIPAQTIAQGSAPQTLDLTQSFADNTTEQADLTFSTSSSNTALIQPSISSSTLTLTLAPTGSGFASVTVDATAPDGSQAAQIFRVEVPASTDRSLDVVLGQEERSFRYVESNGSYSTITLSGPGTADIHLGGDNLVQVGDRVRGSNQEVESVTLSGTTEASQLVVSGVPHGRSLVYPEIGNISSDGALGYLYVHNTVLLGDVNITGGVDNLRIDGAQDGTITVGQASRPMKLTLGNFEDENFSTPSGISTLNDQVWANNDSIPETLSAAYINSLTGRSNFEVGLQLSGTGAGGKSLGHMLVYGLIGATWNLAGPSVALNVGAIQLNWNATFVSLPSITDRGYFGGVLNVPAIGSIKVHGEMVDATLDLTAANTTDLAQLNVKGPIVSSAIESVGNLGPISAQSLQQSVVYAGVGQLQQGEVVPSSAAELAATSTIQSITLHPTAKVVGFRASDIAAAVIGILSFGTTEVDNSSVAFGIAATSIYHLSARDLSNHQVINLANISDPTVLANEIAASGLNLQDFTITVLQ